MRKIWLLPLSLVLVFLSGCDKPGEEEIDIPTDGTAWEIIHTSANCMPALSSGDIFSSGEFIAVGGDGGFVGISTDGGDLWSSTRLETMYDEGYSVDWIAFKNEQTGILAGKSSLYRTTDGGENWQQVATDIITEGYVKFLQYIGENTFYAMYGSDLLITDDNGVTWTTRTVSVLTDMELGATGMAFHDEEHGVIGTNGRYALYTYDTGETWNIEDVGMDTIFFAVTDIDEDKFFMCGEDGMIIFRELVETTFAIIETAAVTDTTWEDTLMIIDTTGWVYDTTGWIEDTLIDWRRTTNLFSRSLISIDFHGNYGIAVGVASGDESVLISTDEGMNWTITHEANVFGDLQQVTFDPGGNHVLMVGSDAIRGGGAVRIGSGDFSSWKAANYGTSITITDIEFTSSQEGVAVGKKGGIYTTDDGGYTLMQKVCPIVIEEGDTVTDITISSVSFPTAFDGVAVGTDEFIMKTSDGGETWQTVVYDSTSMDHLNEILMTSENIGYILGNGGNILKTEDGGDNWYPLETPVEVELLSLYFLNNDEGWVVGDAGVIIYTSNGGATWTEKESGVNNALTGVSFTDASHGWICGNLTILRTTNGGNSWQFTEVQPNIFAFFRDIGFVDSNRGWIVGNFGYILHTVDGGDTWYRQAEGYTEANLYSLKILDGSHIWAAGDNGTVLKLIP